MRLLLFRTLLVVLVMSVAACGFQLRGAYNLPYESLYIAAPDYSVVGAGLKRAVRATGSTRLAENADDAQAIFRPTGEIRLPIILSLSSAGRVREKRLTYRYNFRIVNRDELNLIAPVTIELYRDITYADSDVLAKTQEEELLWRDMENDLVQQLLRRLSTLKPVFPSAED